MPSLGKRQKCFKGFTLAELLVALLILGEIATFAIPKILSAQQNKRSNAIAKEAAGMFAAAWQQASLAGNIRVGTGVADLTQYMNYVTIDTSTPIDDWPTYGSWGCSPALPCLTLHNGAKVVYDLADTYSGLGSTNWIHIQVDPDGVYSGTTADGPSKAIGFSIYSNGRLTTDGVRASNSAYDPSWFSW